MLWPLNLKIRSRPAAPSEQPPAVAKAEPDGYTILVHSNALVTAPAIQNMPYDPVQDFAGITPLGNVPLVLVALINSHSRLTDRGQIFEYVFIAWLVGFLLTGHERRERSFFIVPLLVQLAWVQLHSSFLLGPALAAIFFASEWIASKTRGCTRRFGNCAVSRLPVQVCQRTTKLGLTQELITSRT